MLELEGINYWAVLVAWLVNVVIGSSWYAPYGFGKTWTKLSGVDIVKLPQNEANKAIIFVALSAVVQAFVLALILNSLNVSGFAEGLTAGIALWAGLTAATTIGTNFYSRKGWKFWWLNTSYFLVVMSINSVVLAIWK